MLLLLSGNKLRLCPALGKSSGDRQRVCSPQCNRKRGEFRSACTSSLENWVCHFSHKEGEKHDLLNDLGREKRAAVVQTDLISPQKFKQHKHDCQALLSVPTGCSVLLSLLTLELWMAHHWKGSRSPRMRFGATWDGGGCGKNEMVLKVPSNPKYSMIVIFVPYLQSHKLCTPWPTHPLAKAKPTPQHPPAH